MAPTLYIVATPIGNRDDTTTRALQVLGDVDFIVAEDTRHSGQLLSYFGIKKPLISFRDAPQAVMSRAIKLVLERLMRGESGAYVTDAGTPGVSDPAWRLVQAALEARAAVIPIPGPSAVPTLVSIADTPLDEYRFVGFLPKKKGYQTKIEELVGYLNHKERRGVILFESPHRVRKTLTDLMQFAPSLHAIIGRELTKKFETIYRGLLTPELIKSLPERGEYTILIHTVNQ